jgi:hypothetical protein
MVLARAWMPTHWARCVLHVPSLNQRDWRVFLYPHGESDVRRFLQKRLPFLEEAREGATFTIQLRFRLGQCRGDRWTVLARWHTGESIERTLQTARASWLELAGISRSSDQ